MLQLRPSCEHCHKPLPYDAGDARICSFECTFCSECAEHVLSGICPNCNGNLVGRPIRPGSKLEQFPASQVDVFKPVDMEQHGKRVELVKSIPVYLR